jgi:CUB domain
MNESNEKSIPYDWLQNGQAKLRNMQVGYYQILRMVHNFTQVTAYFWLFVSPLAANDVSTNLQKIVEPALEKLLQFESASTRRDPAACSAGGQPLELTDYSGWFVSPDYPDYYPNNANCNWLIRSQEPGGVSVLLIRTRDRLQS